MVELDFVFLRNFWLCTLMDSIHDKLDLDIFCYHSTELLWKGGNIPVFGVATNGDIMAATGTMASELVQSVTEFRVL